MAGVLDKLGRFGATALDYATPDALFGNIGKVGHRAQNPYESTSVLGSLMGAGAQATPQPNLPQASAAPSGLGGPQQRPDGQITGQPIRNGFGILDRVLGGQTITGAMEGQRQAQLQRTLQPQIIAQRQQDDEMRRAVLQNLRDTNQIDEREYYLALTNPDAFGKVSEQRSMSRVVAPESSIYQGGEFLQAPAAAPKPVDLRPQIITAPDGLHEYDPATRTSRKLQSWQQFAPQRARAGGGDSPRVYSDSEVTYGGN